MEEEDKLMIELRLLILYRLSLLLLELELELEEDKLIIDFLSISTSSSITSLTSSPV